MSAVPEERSAGFELWAWLAFVLAAAMTALFLTLGARPGGDLGPWLYTRGVLLLGLASTAVLGLGLLWSVLHRPVLGRRRLLPLLVLALCVVAASLPFPYPSSHEKNWSAVPFRLPFEGEWRVFWGGERRSENALILSPARRFGFEFVPVGEEGAEVPVLAPAGGRVVALEGLHPDGVVRRPAFGNHVVLEVAPGEYLVVANLRQGALDVERGQEVVVGERLAALGDSAGASRGGRPRLMVHLQDTAVPGRGEGIPMRFRSYQANGRPVEAGVPVGGLRGAVPVGELVRN